MNAILPIHSRFVSAIFAGNKIIEIRKGRFRHIIKKIYIYQTAPVSAIVGEMEITGQSEHETTPFGPSGYPLTTFLTDSAISTLDYLTYTGYDIGKILTFFHIGKVTEYSEHYKPHIVPQSLIYIAGELDAMPILTITKEEKVNS